MKIWFDHFRRPPETTRIGFLDIIPKEFSTFFIFWIFTKFVEISAPTFFGECGKCGDILTHMAMLGQQYREFPEKCRGRNLDKFCENPKNKKCSKFIWYYLWETHPGVSEGPWKLPNQNFIFSAFLWFQWISKKWWKNEPKKGCQNPIFGKCKARFLFRNPKISKKTKCSYMRYINV